MTCPSSAHSQDRKQRELDQEQSLLDVDQSIAEREQVRADRIQQRLDEAQIVLDAEMPADDDDLVAAAFVERRQAELGLAQDRSDAHQTQLDHNQRAQDRRRHVLDEQQAPLDFPPDGTPIVEAAPAAAEERDRALRRRALAAVARAEQAHQRAVEALERVEAYARREERRT